jgi:dTDP-4-amino-4,6-dideoxygalactose transaminase
MDCSSPVKWRITLCEPDVDDLEIQAVTDVLRSRWFTMGDVTEQFEKKFALMAGCRYAFAVTNGTAALHLANLALDIGPGDEVICPALTFVATANATRYTGGRVVFADSKSADDWTISPEDIQRKITPKTKAVSVVHYAGFSCDMTAILKIAKKHRLAVIEDCAHSPMGSGFNLDGTVRSLGTLGDVGCFSFFSNKNMTTGEGGMMTTNDDRIAGRIRSLRSHGMTTLTLERHRGHAMGYDVMELGYNYRIDEIRSAMGIMQLKKLAKNNRKRRTLFAAYCRYLDGDPNIHVPFRAHPLEYSTPHIMPVMVRGNLPAVRQRLKEEGIQTSKHYDLIPTFSLYRDESFKSRIEGLDNILTLPLHPLMSVADIRLIVRIIRSVGS